MKRLNRINIKTIKKTNYLFFLVLSILLLVSCRKGVDETGTADVTYGMRVIEIPEDIKVADAVLTDSNVVILEGLDILDINYDGMVGDRVPLSAVLLETEYLACLDMDKDGNYFALSTCINQEGDAIQGLKVLRFGSDGTLLGDIALEGVFGENEQGPYPRDFIAEGGNFYIQSLGGVYIYDSMGSQIFEVLEARNVGYSKSLFRLGDGRVASSSWEMGENILTVRVYNPTEMSFEEYRITVQGSPSDSIVTGKVKIEEGNSTDIIISDSTGLYEYGLEKGNREYMLNFLDYSVNVSEIGNLSLTRGGDFVCVLGSSTRIVERIAVFRPWLSSAQQSSSVSQPLQETESNEPELEYITPAQEGFEVPKEKATITIAVMQMDEFNNSWLRNYITEFNKRNSNYTIQTKIYMTHNDYEGAIRQLGIELISGNAPDIIVCEIGMQVRSYISKGIFTDLYELMDNDPDFNRDDYLPNVFEAIEVDGKLHSIFPMFRLHTLTAKASDVEEGPNWTIEEFLEFLESNPDADYIIEDYTKQRFVSEMVTYYFADPKTGEVIFDREAFLKILEAAERFPLDELPENNKYAVFMMGAKDGDPLLTMNYLSFRSVRIEKEIYFGGEDITFKGFPVPEGSGLCFIPRASFAITENSVSKEGAWEFIKFTLEEVGIIFHRNFPIKISELEKTADEATINPKNWYNGEDYENEIMVGYDDNGKPWVIKYNNNTAEDNAQIMDLILATNRVFPFTDVIQNIINEEVNAYFNGQKNPDQVADIIENRVNLYIRESE